MQLGACLLAGALELGEAHGQAVTSLPAAHLHILSMVLRPQVVLCRGCLCRWDALQRMQAHYWSASALQAIEKHHRQAYTRPPPQQCHCSNLFVKSSRKNKLGTCSRAAIVRCGCSGRPGHMDI